MSYFLGGRKSRVAVETEPGAALRRLVATAPLGRYFILVDRNVPRARVRGILRFFRPAGVRLSPGGERVKSWPHCERLQHWLNLHRASRKDWLIALGGGAVCDLAGFAAATFHRGMRLGLIPTTLLSQVDAAIGFKNGLNRNGAKNGLGSFYAPEWTYCATGFWHSRPPSAWASGLAEVIKLGYVGPRGLLKDVRALLNEPTPQKCARLARRAIAAKMNIVRQDPLDEGIRGRLNFGHTFGHALETTHPALNHGQAVALGMTAALLVSWHRGLCPWTDVTGLVRLLRRAGLPADPGPFLKKPLAAALIEDKKRASRREVLFWFFGKDRGIFSARLDVHKLENCLKKAYHASTILGGSI